MSLIRCIATAIVIAATSCQAAYAASEVRNDIEIIEVQGDRLAISAAAPSYFSVTLNRDDLVNRNILDTGRMFDAIPNMVSKRGFTPSNNEFGGRGLAQVINGPPACAIVVNGVPLAESKLITSRLFDVESVTFAAGPSGDIAPNALCGVISINTTRPGDNLSGRARVQLGENGHRIVEASVSGPIGADLSLGLSGYYDHSDGQLENTFLNTGADFNDGSFGARVTGVYRPSEAVTIDVIGWYAAFDVGAAYDSVVINNDPNEFLASTANRLGNSEGEDYGATIKIAADIREFFTFTSISNFTGADEENIQDLDYAHLAALPNGAFGADGPDAGRGSAGRFRYSGISQVFQDFRISRLRTGARQFGVDFGGSFFRTRYDFPAELFLDNPAVPSDMLFAGVVDPNDLIFNQALGFQTFIYALYARAEYQPFDRLTLQASLRLEEMESEQTDRGLNRALSETFSSLPWRFAANYNLGRINLFTSCGSASRAGGFNSSGLEPYGQETLTSCEAGFNSSLMDGRITLRAVGFCGRVTDYQVFALVEASQFITNIPRARICGSEGRLDYALSNHFQLYIDYGLLESSIVRAPSRPDLIGNATPNTVNHTINFGGSMNLPLGQGVELVSAFNARRIGKRIWDLENQYNQSGKTFVDARFGLKLKKLSVSIVIENLNGARAHDNFTGPPGIGREYSLGNPDGPQLFWIELGVEL